MASKSLILLFFTLLSLALVLNASTAKREPQVGGWKLIKDTKDPKAVEIAQFAVSEYNKKGNHMHKLIYEKIEKGEYQVVAGIKYRLTIKATAKIDHLKPRDSMEYMVVVWDKPSKHTRELISFNRVKKSV